MKEMGYGAFNPTFLVEKSGLGIKRVTRTLWP